MEGNGTGVFDMISGLRTRNRLLFTLAVIMGCVVAALLSLYMVNRITSTEPIIKNIGIDSKTLVALGAMRQTSTRNGIKEWTLEAASARIIREKHLAVLTDVSVLFFLATGEEIHLTSKAGTIDTEQQDMTFSDTVVVSHDAQFLETDRLQYEKKRHIIYSMNPVILTTPRAKMTADRMTLDLNTHVVRLTGHFDGRFSTNGQLF